MINFRLLRASVRLGQPIPDGFEARGTKNRVNDGAIDDKNGSVYDLVTVGIQRDPGKFDRLAIQHFNR